ncbi:DegQ family serine endoprotease [Isoalcanivorax beigongshangi]|uniref:Probable periplasmic serine endoprotease DegP-like n=1 Tax=Isoalcanivorax beigongshangi TaxID=3238810 RepID=A0ABV4AI58_9GAMM
MINTSLRLTALAALTGVLVACGPSSSPQQQNSAPAPVTERAPRATVTLPDFAQLVEEHGAAVVNISTIQKVSARRSALSSQHLPEMFRRFFEEFDERGGGEQEAESQGSGFIISKDGYVLTNYHVVRQAERILVRLQDRRELEATLVGQDPQSDLALLRIEEDDLPVVTIGSSNDLRVGEWVLAIGAPFGFESSVTAGIVSALGRSLPSENYIPFIQTDVAINPGNSGGPLFNLNGEVVGINAQIVSQSGGFMGLSFSIPIDMAMDVVKQLKENGRVTRGWLGVMIQEVDRDLAKSFGLPKPAGALVAQVQDDSPAAKAGLQVGDVIIAMNGAPVDRSAGLPPLVGRLAPGDEATFEVIRDGKGKRIKVTIGELPQDGDADTPATPAASPHPLGLTVEPLSAEDKRKLGLNNGVRVTAVQKGPAEKAGIQTGDILRTLNNVQIDSAQQLASVAKELPKDTFISALVQRGDQPRFLALRLEETP